MTRETKISLLVGLAFIIVIGILLSDHFRSTQELPRAELNEVTSSVHQATDGPQSSNPAIQFVQPPETQPKQAVPTRDELTPPPSPVIPSKDYGNESTANNSGNSGAPAATDDQKQQSNPLGDVAQKNGEPVEPANMDGSSRSGDDTEPQAQPPAPASSQREYIAQEGDSVSRMAAKFLGENNKENRQAIIDANPSLRDDPNRVIVGKSYVIPGSADSDSQASNAPSPDNSTMSKTTASATGAYFYTVKEGDSLWQIANDELDDPSAVDAIKELNAGVLKGEQHDVVIPGMKLRLPAKPVADSTTN